METYAFSCQTAEFYFHYYTGSFLGCKQAASRYYGKDAEVEIWLTAVCEDAGARVPTYQIAVKCDGKWVECE